MQKDSPLWAFGTAWTSKKEGIVSRWIGIGAKQEGALGIGVIKGVCQSRCAYHIIMGMLSPTPITEIKLIPLCWTMITESRFVTPV